MAAFLGDEEVVHLSRVDDRFRRGHQAGGAREIEVDGAGHPRLEARAVAIDLVLELEPHAQRPAAGVDDRIDERNLPGVRLARRRRQLQPRLLAHVDAREVLLVDLGGHPDPGQVGHLEQHRPGLHGDPRHRALGDDVAVDGRADRDGLDGLARPQDLVDLLARDPEQLQPATGVRIQARREPVVLVGRPGVGAVPAARNEHLLLGPEHVRAVDRRECLAAPHPLSRLGDQELLDPAREPGVDLRQPALVRADHADRPQLAADLLALDRRGAHSDELDAFGGEVHRGQTGDGGLGLRGRRRLAVGAGGRGDAASSFGTSVMPQIGHWPGWSCTIAGCIGQV